MPESGRYLTFDLGAESGRAVLGSIEDGKLDLKETHRFPNEPQYLLGKYYWDTVRLFAEMKHGLTHTIKEHGPEIDGIGVDTWGVDFGLLDHNDELIGMPRHYRDARTDEMMARAFEIVPRYEIYQQTGIQFMQLNTLYQLLAMQVSGSPQLEQAKTFLTMPDLLNYWLTGEKVNEFTEATTTQCFNPSTGDWARPLMQKLGIPTDMFGKIIQPGTEIGSLHKFIQDETGAGPIRVIAPATHDTGSAVAAVPAEGKDGWAFISCGTWSLIGVEWPEPIISEQTLKFNLTNEGGVAGTYRVLRNVMGLWLLQRCRRSWEKAGYNYGYADLAGMADQAPAFKTLVDPDDNRFLNPPDMPDAIAAYCRGTGQMQPDGIAATVRCIVESLALKYRQIVEMLEKVTGKPIHTIHMIGGGSQNKMLCQAAANATGRNVVAGPVEATAAGNILTQAISVGQISSVAEGRAIVRRSFELEHYMPQAPEAWDGAYQKFLSLS